MSNITIRSALPSDTSTIFALIQELAKYENLENMVTGSEQKLRNDLFGEQIYAEAIIAEWNGKAVGFALFFPNYSTFLTKAGIYLEDLFVLPEYRRRGIGKALLQHLKELATKRDAGRLEWSVLDWNEPAIKFYQSIGAKVLPDWRICRITFD